MRRVPLLLFVLALAPGCGLSPEAARKALASVEPSERRKAAEALQAMYAKSPASLGDHGEAYWSERLAKARGKTSPKAVKILGGAKLSGGEAGGGGESVLARLDDFWVATLGRSTRGDDTVFSTDKPRRVVVHVDVRWPANFTGTWTTYYVHGAPYEEIVFRSGSSERVRQFHEGGQLASETRFVDGKADGTFVTRSAAGLLEREEVWSKGAQLSGRAFYSSGKVELETTYAGGKIDRERRFLETGAVASCQVFRKGAPEPCTP